MFQGLTAAKLNLPKVSLNLNLSRDLDLSRRPPTDTIRSSSQSRRW